MIGGDQHVDLAIAVRDEERPAGAREPVLGGVRERGGVAAGLERDDDDAPVAGEPEAREPLRHVGGAPRAGGEAVEEVALEPVLGLRDGSRLGELDREQRERVTAHDPIDLRQGLGRTDREERLDATSRPDGLDPHALTAVDEREAEARALGTRPAQLLPHPLRPLPRGRRRLGERHPVEVEQQDPAADDPRERRRDALDAPALQHRAGQRVLGLDGPLQQVVLLGEEAAEDRLGDRDERHRVGDLEEREPGLLGRRRQGLRDLVVAEPQPEPEAGEPRVDQPLEVGALLRGRGADGRPGREQDLAALQPRRRILELGAVDPPDGPADARLAGDEPEREPGDVQDVADGERHGSDCTNRTEGRPRPDGRAA